MELDELERIKAKKLRDMLHGEGGSQRGTTPAIVTDGDFDRVVRENRLAVIDCWAPWCGPCRVMGPIIDGLASKYAGRVFFGKLNVDENPEVPSRYSIMSIPTLLFFKDGELVDRIIGAVPASEIERKLSALGA
ncbi:MAG: thioredoxin [Candidatus Bathyarchaeia archaeon]